MRLSKTPPTPLTYSFNRPDMTAPSNDDETDVLCGLFTILLYLREHVGGRNELSDKPELDLRR